MNEYEKMLNGKIYKTSDVELEKQRDFARNSSRKYNITAEKETSKRRDILEELLGSIGENVSIFPYVQFDYGRNTF